MLKLLINNPEFSKELEKPSIKNAFSLELESIAMYEFYNNIYQDSVIFSILNARNSIKQLFSKTTDFMPIECPLKDAYLVLLAQELKLVQACKNACVECESEHLKDLLFRLWASSSNEYQVALRQSLFSEQGLESLVNNFLKDIIK